MSMSKTFLTRVAKSAQQIFGDAENKLPEPFSRFEIQFFRLQRGTNVSRLKYLP